MQSAISFAGKPAHGRPPSRRQGAPSPSSLSARRGQHLASHAVSQGLCRPNTGAGEHPESPTRRRVAPPRQTVPQRPLGLGLASYHQQHDDDEAPRGLARCTAASAPGPGRGRGVRQVSFGLWGRGMPSGAPCFLVISSLGRSWGKIAEKQGRQRTNKEKRRRSISIFCSL